MAFQNKLDFILMKPIVGKDFLIRIHLPRSLHIVSIFFLQRLKIFLLGRLNVDQATGRSVKIVRFFRRIETAQIITEMRGKMFQKTMNFLRGTEIFFRDDEIIVKAPVRDTVHVVIAKKQRENPGAASILDSHDNVQQEVTVLIEMIPDQLVCHPVQSQLSILVIPAQLHPK